MGRKSLNKTYEQILEEGRLRANKYYNINKEICRKKALDRYYKIKTKSLNKYE